MSVAATLDWPRILTPAEVAAIRSVIDMPRLEVLFDVMLYTGMLYAESRQLRDDPERFDVERGTLAILTQKKKQRTIVLGDRGREAVEEFIGRGAQMPARDFGWRVHLVRWSKMARLPPHPNPPPGASPGNPAGIGSTSTRKTWESWLYALQPEWLRPIMASQGRSATGDITRYGALSWSADDLDAMRLETAGWEPLHLRDQSRSPPVAGHRPLTTIPPPGMSSACTRTGRPSGRSRPGPAFRPASCMVIMSPERIVSRAGSRELFSGQARRRILRH